MTTSYLPKSAVKNVRREARPYRDPSEGTYDVEVGEVEIDLAGEVRTITVSRVVPVVAGPWEANWTSAGQPALVRIGRGTKTYAESIVLLDCGARRPDTLVLASPVALNRSAYWVGWGVESNVRTGSVGQYTTLAKASGDKCLHVQRRSGGRQDLFCIRALGHDGNHLHDVHPGGAQYGQGRWTYGEAARREAAAQRAGFASYADEERHNR